MAKWEEMKPGEEIQKNFKGLDVTLTMLDGHQAQFINSQVIESVGEDADKIFMNICLDQVIKEDISISDLNMPQYHNLRRFLMKFTGIQPSPGEFSETLKEAAEEETEEEKEEKENVEQN